MEIDRIEELLLEIKKVSEDKGYILNEEIEELVGAGFDPDEIVELYDRLSDENIEFFDSREKAILKLEARKKREQKEAKKSEEMLTTTVRYDDPVRMYLREMGKVPLLDREGEIEIAKRIEDGHLKVFQAVFRLNATTKELKRYVDRLEKGTIRLEDLVQVETGGLHPHLSGRKEVKKYAGILKRIIKLREEVVDLEVKLKKKHPATAAAQIQRQLEMRNRKLQEEYRKIKLNPLQLERLVEKIKEVLKRIEQHNKRVHEYEKFVGMNHEAVDHAIKILGGGSTKEKLALKKKVPAGAGTLPTHTPLFIAWLIAVVIIVGALGFLPALALGPIVEHLMIFH